MYSVTNTQSSLKLYAMGGGGGKKAPGTVFFVCLAMCQRRHLDVIHFIPEVFYDVKNLPGSERD